MDRRIRLSSTDSVNSVDKKNILDVDIKRHAKQFPFPSLKYTIDQMEQFELERSMSTKYRLILTINPYCSNILFNAVTEIVQNEGTDKPEDLHIISKTPSNVSINDYNIKGKTSVTNVDMVRNTEYANGSNPFVYHCGYDIFNNHILRNQTFKLVNIYSDSADSTEKDVFNTIRDYMRYSNGENVELTKRTDINTIIVREGNSGNFEKRHLYLKDDILNFIDSINANLYEQNGWWGFNNRSSIESCKFNKTSKGWENLDISKTFNGEHSACEFIELYPDSTLFSFNPKYNSFQNREEQNWDICITYPYKNDDGYHIETEDNVETIVIDKKLTHGVVRDGEKVEILNALLLASYEQTIGTSGQDIVLFRSYVKHNLKRSDEIKLFYLNKEKDETEFHEIKDKLFKVINIGNLEDENHDYYFYINDVNDLINELGEVDDLSYTDFEFRFVKVVNERDCKYYYRKFKKLPNFKFKKQELTDEIVQNRELFEEYITNNCMKDEKTMLLFAKEQYPLAFSKTIYGDGNTQVTFTDTLDIDKLTDNLNRPLTELYVTILKRNKGHDLWYNSVKTEEDLKNIEYSHCFGSVSTGINIHGEFIDDNIENGLLTGREQVNDVTLLTNNIKSLDDDVTIDNNEFYGDVVELNCYDMVETVLSDVYFRFNTEQREHIFNEETELNCGNFVYDEIIEDDYDYNGFNCEENDMDEVNKVQTTYRPEGYYYKAHYPFLVREFGAMRQDSHEELEISSCSLRQVNGLFIEVVSTLRNHIVSGDIVFLCDDKEKLTIPLFVNETLNNVRFLISPMIPSSDENYKSVFDIVEGLMHSEARQITETDIANGYNWKDENGIQHIAQDAILDENEEVITPSDLGRIVYDYSKPKYVLRIKNPNIPSYAYEVGTNIYLWRDLLTVGNKDTVNLQEYPFANGCFYVNKNINFFLKRQDPFGDNELYNEEIIPNDIAGNVRKQDNYEYKSEEDRIC